MERLFGEILVGLDRSGQLRRLSAGTRPSDGPRGDANPRRRTADLDPARARRPSNSPRATGPPVATRRARRSPRRPDPVERLLGLIRDELRAPISGA